MLTREENELLTRTGPSTPMGNLMRRYWVPALFSSQLPEPDCPPLRVRLLGEDLVAFRDTDGRVGLLDEHCAHRGASLFFGRNEESGLRCVYHGWKYDVDGSCVDMPNEPAESNFKHKIKITAYPCRERGDIVWAYMGPSELQPALPELEWMSVPASHRYATRRWQDCNWLQAFEGGIDAVHVPFLHRGDLPSRRGAELPTSSPVNVAPTFELVPRDYGYMIGNGRDVEPDRRYWSVTQILMPFHKLIPRAPGDTPIGAHVWVPIDDENCMVYSVEYHPDRPLGDDEMEASRAGRYIHATTLPGGDRPVANKGNDYLIDRALQASGKSYTGIPGQGMQDSAIQESEGAIYDRTQEHLASTDIAIVTIRHYYLRVLRELAAGATPPGLDPASHHIRSTGVMAPRATAFEEVVADTVRAALPSPA